MLMTAENLRQEAACLMNVAANAIGTERGVLASELAAFYLERAAILDEREVQTKKSRDTLPA